MALLDISPKKLQIDKANSRIFAIIAATAVIVIFCLVSAKSLVGQAAFQSRVLQEKKTANEQLEENINAVKDLERAYVLFASETTNVLGGSRTGQGPLDGDNAKIVLDSLPSKYDFPALQTSLEKVMLNRSVKIDNISGQDDEANQNGEESAPATEPLAIDFTLEGTAGYATMTELVRDFEKSIRPFVVRTIEFSGSETQMRINVAMQTYYQPLKKLEISTKEVK